MRPVLPILVLILTLSRPDAGLASAAPAPVTAEQALAAYHDRIDRVMRRRCIGDAAGGEIVVCGRSRDNQSQAVPFPDMHEPGFRHHLIAGEPPSAVGALAVGGSCCGAGSGLDVIELARTLNRGLGRILHPD